MARVVNTGFDPHFTERLKQFRAALEAVGIKTDLISGARTPQDQKELVENRAATIAGRPLPHPDRGPVWTVAPVGSSAHQFGLAGDLVPVNRGDYGRMHAMAQQFGLEMPNWNGRDPAHVQMQGWQQYAQSQPPPTPWQTAEAQAQGRRQQVDPGAPASNSSYVSATGGGGALPGQNPMPARPGQGGSTLPSGLGQGQGTAVNVPASMFQSLIGRGLTPQQALGVIYSHGGESGNFNSSVLGDNGNSIGIGQWNGDRRINLQAVAKGMGTTETDPSAQLAHWNKELDGPYASVIEQVKGAKTAADAARIYTGSADTASGYERPKVNNWQQRTAEGSQRFSVDDNGALVDKGGGSGGTTVANRQAPAPAPSAWESIQKGDWGGALKAVTTPKMDDKGNPIQGSSPLNKLAEGIKSSYGSAPAAPEPSPIIQAPAGATSAFQARQSSLGASAGQLLAQILQQRAQPLSWGRAPPGSESGQGMPQAPAIGTTLNFDPSNLYG